MAACWRIGHSLEIVEVKEPSEMRARGCRWWWRVVGVEWLPSSR